MAISRGFQCPDQSPFHFVFGEGDRKIFPSYPISEDGQQSDYRTGSIHTFDIFCRDQGIIHYLIDPGKPAQNGTVERICLFRGFAEKDETMEYAVQ